MKDTRRRFRVFDLHRERICMLNFMGDSAMALTQLLFQEKRKVEWETEKVF